jgi:hypothetical protein
MRGGKEANEMLGRHAYGRANHGYRSPAAVVEPVPELVAIVRRIFADARDGRSPARIARELNGDAVSAQQSGHPEEERLRMQPAGTS